MAGPSPQHQQTSRVRGGTSLLGCPCAEVVSAQRMRAEDAAVQCDVPAYSSGNEPRTTLRYPCCVHC